MSLPREYVVLLDDDNQPIGQEDKAVVHHQQTPRHLAFSCYITNQDGLLLVTRRALSKVAWPGIWTNSVCGHPGPNESFEQAILRRAEQELGTKVARVECMLPDFHYRAVDDSGIVENEFCPVHQAVISAPLVLNPDEVMQYQWVEPKSLLLAIQATPWAFSPWMVEQVRQLAQVPGSVFHCSA
ncbi:MULTISPECIES: isopentenyl-diphosphate Delta-isomerase [unclassified Vibrio]|uniref:Isopentenyl-diphosphate Delta-isomerase n=1 Tax=Vibrio sp. HB236076 TaxID=3232307 RepID=A0AB39HEQ0_9VIBR|nr:isopentenyl-diphosphate Delta-isomerase [Vibrio sp. HB161653]MDP5252810.1 isopentenyl-diphosphate Delta-isomerase [Vibrio sp. HB161653]